MTNENNDFKDIEPFDIKKSKQIKNLSLKKKEIQNYFESPQCMTFLTKSLPRVGITAERLTRLIFSAITRIPKLAECSPQSLFNAMIQCAQIGLEPNTALGHAYVIPFWNNKTKTTDVTLIIGYKGMIALARRSGEFSHISAHAVFPGDHFEVKLGTEEYIIHEPNFSTEHKSREMMFCYAVAKFKDGSYLFEVMPKNEIDNIRMRSKSPNVGPWDTDYIQMARKTVIRRLMNYLPLSSEMAEAVKVDGEREAGIDSIGDMLGNILPESINETKEIEETKEESKKERRKPKEKAQPEQKKESSSPSFEMAKKSLNLRNVTDTEIMAYFDVDDLDGLDCEEGLKELQRIAIEIESENITVEEFKKSAAERYEMKQKEENNKKPLL